MSFTRKQQYQLARLYQLVTSNVVTSKDTEESIMHELLLLKTKLREDANELYQLGGIFSDIHIALIAEELDFYNVDELLFYLELFKYDIVEELEVERNHLKIATGLVIAKITTMENFRITGFINSIFFQSHIERSMIFPGVTSFQKIPSGNDIQRFGPDYYYPRFGELNVENLLERFDFRELVHMAGMLNRLYVEELRLKNYPEDILKAMRFTLHNQIFPEDIAKYVIFLCHTLRFDVRGFLTPLGPEFIIISETFVTPTSIHDDVYVKEDELIEVCANEGIALKFNGKYKHRDVLWQEYVMTHLCPNFATHPGEHRSILEAASNRYTTDGTKIEEILDDNEILLYGKRDGVSKMHIYTVKELLDTFSELEDFFDPESIRKNPRNVALWYRFPHDVINYLIQKILPHMRKSRYAIRLTEVIQKILRKDDLSEVPWQNQQGFMDQLSALTIEKRNKLREVFIRMYNIGGFFENFNDHIDSYDTESMEKLLQDNPLYQPPPPIYTGRVAVKCRNYIMRIQEAIAEMNAESAYVNRLYMLRLVDDTTIVLYDDRYSIGHFLKCMLEFARYNLVKPMIEAGKMLRATSTAYMEKFTKQGIGAINIEVRETSEMYERVSGSSSLFRESYVTEV